jgi:hypothetical protein
MRTVDWESVIWATRSESSIRVVATVDKQPNGLFAVRETPPHMGNIVQLAECELSSTSWKLTDFMFEIHWENDADKIITALKNVARSKNRTLVGVIMELIKTLMSKNETLHVDDAWEGGPANSLNSFKLKQAAQTIRDSHARIQGADYLVRRFDRLNGKGSQSFATYIDNTIKGGYYGAWNLSTQNTSKDDIIVTTAEYSTERALTTQ